MKIIFLNAWDGKMKENLTEFLREQLSDTDIFCLQETYRDSVSLWQSTFVNHRNITADKCIVSDEDFAQSIYIRGDMKVLSSQTLFDREKGCGLGIYLEMEYKGKILHICNFHGVAFPGDKLDTPNRLKQSERLIDFMREKNGPKIIGGDFNLLPNTRSVKMFEEFGYRNLIEDFDIKMTRNHLVWDRFQGKRQYYADYVFVSQDVQVENFSVIDNEVSDHLPLILEITDIHPILQALVR